MKRACLLLLQRSAPQFVTSICEIETCRRPPLPSSNQCVRKRCGNMKAHSVFKLPELSHHSLLYKAQSLKLYWLSPMMFFFLPQDKGTISTRGRVRFNSLLAFHKKKIPSNYKKWVYQNVRICKTSLPEAQKKKTISRSHVSSQSMLCETFTWKVTVL